MQNPSAAGLSSNAMTASSAPSTLPSFCASPTCTLTSTRVHVSGLLQQRRYRQAEKYIRAIIVQQQAKAKQRPADNPASTISDSAASCSCPLSRVLSVLLPLLRSVTRCATESETGLYDLMVLTREAEEEDEAEGKATEDMPIVQSPSSVLARADRRRHAEFVHPSLRCATMKNKGRGVIVKRNAGIAGQVAESTNNPNRPPSTVTVVIPANTTLMCCRAAAIVSEAEADAEASNTDGGTDAANTSNSPSSSTSLSQSSVTRLAGSLASRLSSLIRIDSDLHRRLLALDGGEAHKPLAGENDAEEIDLLDSYRPVPVSQTDAEVNDPAKAPAVDNRTDGTATIASAELLDEPRLRGIVARNAFSPPHARALSAHASSSSSISSTSSSRLGLWPACSFINSSCRPNAHWFSIGAFMFVRSIRDIHEGEEVTISYTGFDAQTRRQRSAMHQGWGFQCSCVEVCAVMGHHPKFESLEERLAAEIKRLEPRVHALVDELHGSEEASTVARAASQLRATQDQLQKLVTNFQHDLNDICDGECPHNMGKKTPASLFPTSSSPFLRSIALPPACRFLQLHFALPFSLLFLCATSLLAIGEGLKSESDYLRGLSEAEGLVRASYDILADEYGAGDEVAIFELLTLLNTCLQFQAAGIEYKSDQEMKRILHEECIQPHMRHFGSNKQHFLDNYAPLMQQMGLDILME